MDDPMPAEGGRIRRRALPTRHVRLTGAIPATIAVVACQTQDEPPTPPAAVTAEPPHRDHGAGSQ